MQEIILTSGCKETINIIANVSLWLTSPGGHGWIVSPFAGNEATHLPQIQNKTEIQNRKTQNTKQNRNNLSFFTKIGTPKSNK